MFSAINQRIAQNSLRNILLKEEAQLNSEDFYRNLQFVISDESAGGKTNPVGSYDLKSNVATNRFVSATNKTSIGKPLTFRDYFGIIQN